MRLEATLGSDEIAQLLGELLPTRIRLGFEGQTGRYLCLGRPRQVALSAGVGVRFVSSGKLKWSLAGFDAPIHLMSIQMLLKPVITHGKAGEALAFHLAIERCEFPALTSLVGKDILDVVNRELLSTHAELLWPFARALSSGFDLPGLSPAMRVDLDVARGEVRVEDDGLVLTVDLRAVVARDRASIATLEGTAHELRH